MLIGIAGTIGAGKSTLCKELVRILPEITGEPWEILPEPVTDNPYLGLFYEDPKRWAFTMQMFLLLRRFEAACVPDVGGNYIQDRTLQEDRIFAVLALKRNLMTEEEFAVYDGYYKVLSSSRRILRPEVTLYLQVSLETSIERIKTRGRDVEGGLFSTQEGKNYLKELLQEYEKERLSGKGRKWKAIDWNNGEDSIFTVLELLKGSIFDSLGS